MAKLSFKYIMIYQWAINRNPAQNSPCHLENELNGYIKSLFFRKVRIVQKVTLYTAR